MAGAINSISTFSAMQATSISSSSSNRLSEETKKKLEALGIDTSNIKTEAEGQAKLNQVKAAQSAAAEKANQTHQNSGVPTNVQMETIKSQAVELAQKLGAKVDSNEKLANIMAAISEALKNYKVQSVNSPEKLEKYQAYQKQYDAISSSLQSMEDQKSSQSKMSNSMAAMANYNIAFFNLG